MRHLNRISFLALGIALLGLSGCGGTGSNNPYVFGGNAAMQWDQTLLTMESKAKLGPPATARALAIVHTAMYDAWACYDAKASGTIAGKTLRRPEAERTDANKVKAISFAAYRALVDLFPAQKADADAKMAFLGFDPTDVAESDTTPSGLGNKVARLLLASRHDDGANQLGNLAAGAYSDYTGYVPTNTPDVVIDPSKWQPLRFANGATPGYIAPHWGNVVPFGMTSGSEFRPPAPPTYGSPTYIAQIQDMLAYTEVIDDEKKVIAEYWADGPGSVLPPGHWMIFGQWVSQRDRHTLDQDIKMFFLLGNAVMDASIACWDAKRFYNTSRPITAIRNLMVGQQVMSFISPASGFGLVDGSAWLPYQSPNFITPPFPEYTSGHSTFSAAGAEILKRFTGSDTFGMSVNIPAGSMSFEPGVPAAPMTLSWGTFTDAADQAGISRLIGGIHFTAGDREGRRCGRLVAEAVWDRGNAFISGTIGRDEPLP